MRLKERAERYSRAWAYARRRLSPDQAQRIFLDCQYPAGWHPLLVLTVEDTLEQAHEDFHDHPELARLINDGCSRVSHKWESINDDLYEARRWAIDLAGEYAGGEGLAFERIDAAGFSGDGPEAQQFDKPIAHDEPESPAVPAPLN